MGKSIKVYRAFAEDDAPRMPERKRSPRAKAQSIARRQARALKSAGVTL